jgi:hypothetical protein
MVTLYLNGTAPKVNVPPLPGPGGPRYRSRGGRGAGRGGPRNVFRMARFSQFFTFSPTDPPMIR